MIFIPDQSIPILVQAFFLLWPKTPLSPPSICSGLGLEAATTQGGSLSPLALDVLLELINIPLAGTLTPVPSNMLENIGYAWAFVPGRINRVALEPAWRCLIGNTGGLHSLTASLASGCPCSAVRMQLLELGGRTWLCVWDGDWILRISFPLWGRHPVERDSG